MRAYGRRYKDSGKPVDGQLTFYFMPEYPRTLWYEEILRKKRQQQKQRSENAKYKRNQRRRNMRCTVCGVKLTDTSYMICCTCREKAARYMMETRHKRKKDI